MASGDHAGVQAATGRPGISVQSMLIGEIQVLMTVMRRSRKWKTDPLSLNKNQGFHANTHIQDLQRLRWSLNPTEELDPLAVVKPFVEVIKADDTTGLATGLAIASLHKLITAGFFDVNGCGNAKESVRVDALVAVVDALTHCRFESTDHRRDELTLMKMLQAQAACLSCSAGKYLPEEDVWTMIQTCYRVYKVMRPPDYSDLLCEAAELILREMVSVVFTDQHLTPTQNLPKPLPSDGEMKQENKAKYSRFGLSCAVRVMDFVCSLCMTHSENQATHAQTLGCQLLISILETNAEGILKVKELMRFIKDEICYFLISKSASGNPLILNFTLRIVYLLYTHMRSKLNMQTETLLSQIYIRILDQKQAVPYEIRESLIESLLDLARLPCFFQDLYANYDCQLRYAELCKSLLQVLCRSALPSSPTNALLTTNHVLSLEVLLRALESVNRRSMDAKDGDEKEAKKFDKKLLLKGSLKNLAVEKAKIDECVEQFNKKPREGIRLMQEYEFLSKNSVLRDDQADREFNEYLKILSKHNKTVFNAEYKQRKERKRTRDDLIKQKGISHEEAEKILGPLPKLKHPTSPTLDPSTRHALRAEKLRPDATRAAHILRTHPGVNLAILGEYLGEPKQMNHYVREAFVNTFDFKGMTVDIALRQYLEAFRLPKEAQQIDRCVQNFASRYHRQNPGYLHSEDGVYTLVFSLIMLTTDLHNPLVPKKMSLDQYLLNTKYVDDGDDVPREELERLYKAISNREISMSGRGSGRQMSPELWKDVIHRSRTLPSPEFIGIPEFESGVDRMVYGIVWKPLIGVLSVVYSQAKQESVINLVEQGYGLLASLASRFNLPSMLDSTVSSIIPHTGLLEKKGKNGFDFTSSLVDFASQPNQLRACKIYFDNVGRFGCFLPWWSWSVIVKCFLRLHLMNVLPKTMAMLNDLVSGSRSRTDILTLYPVRFRMPEEAAEGMVSSLFNTMTSYFSASPGQANVDIKSQKTKLHQIAQDCILRCEVDAILPTTKKMPINHLLGLMCEFERMCDIPGVSSELHTICWHNTVYLSTRRKHSKKIFEELRKARVARRHGVKRNATNSHSGSTDTAAKPKARENGSAEEGGLMTMVNHSAIIRGIASQQPMAIAYAFAVQENEEKTSLRAWLEQKQRRGITDPISDGAGGEKSPRLWSWDKDGWLPVRLREALLLVHLFTQITLHNSHRFKAIFRAVESFFTHLILPIQNAKDTPFPRKNPALSSPYSALTTELAQSARQTSGPTNIPRRGSDDSKLAASQRDTTARSTPPQSIPKAVLEAAVVSLMVITSQMLDNPENHEMVPQILELVLKINDKKSVLISEQLSYGILLLIREHRCDISHPKTWRYILDLLGRSERTPATRSTGLMALAMIVSDEKCPYLTLTTFRTATSMLFKFALAFKGDVLCCRCVDLLYLLHRRLVDIIEKETGQDMEDAKLWDSCCRPLLSAMCTLCWKLPEEHGTYAMNVFQQLLLSPYLPGASGSAGEKFCQSIKAFSPEENIKPGGIFWKNTLEEVIIPMLQHLASRPKKPKKSNGKIKNSAFAGGGIRQRALNLMVKVFLQKLHTMLGSHNFHVTLVNVIKIIQQYIVLGKSQTLGEMALEALKNLVLVMSSTGLFDPKVNPTGKELCDLTWAHIQPVCPELKNALYRDKEDPEKKTKSEGQVDGQEKKGSSVTVTIVKGNGSTSADTS